MDTVGILIFNTLAGHGRIGLPGIGTLTVVTTPAEMSGKGEVIPPRNRVELLRNEESDGPQIVDLIARQGHADADSAREIYNGWLAGVCTEEGVKIESVGCIRDGVFVPDPLLEQVLNPAGVRAEKLPVRLRPGQIALWIAGAVLVGAALSFGAIAWLEHRDRPRMDGRSTSSVVSVAIPDTEKVPVPDSTVSVVEESSQDADVSTVQEGNVRTNLGTQDAGEAVVPGDYYVIVGTFSTDENADKFIASVRKIDDSLVCRKVPRRNGRIMISIFDSDSQQKAVQKKRQYEGVFEGLWIYRAE